MSDKTTARFCERALRDAGVPRAFAKAVVNHGFCGAERAISHRCDAEVEGLESVIGALKRATANLQSLTEEQDTDADESRNHGQL